MEAIKQTFLTIGSMEVPINEIKEPVVIENLAHSTMLKVKLGVAANKDESQGRKLDSKCFQPGWCSLGLTKMQWCKLQHACCKKKM